MDRKAEPSLSQPADSFSSNIIKEEQRNIQDITFDLKLVEALTDEDKII